MLALLAQTTTEVPTPISAAPETHIPGPDIYWPALIPLIILLVGGLLLLTFSSFLRKRAPRGIFAGATVAIAVAAALSVLPLWAQVQGWSSLLWWDIHPEVPGPYSTIGGMVGVDGFTLFVTIVICVAVALAALLTDAYLRREDMEGPEFYVLMLLSAAGGVIMAMGNDLIVIFIGLETLSLAVYVHSGMHLRRVQSQESGIKYYVLGAFSSAFFLYGIALVYGATGSTNLVDIKTFMSGVVPTQNGLLLIGLGLLIVGLAFKVSAVPFHAWSPDVYDGAPTPAVAWMASGVKAAAFAGMVRIFVLTFSNYEATWKPIVYALAILSMVVGASLAVVQSNVKRMPAYSSISHAGFILMAVQAGSALGNSAVLFYLAAYVFMVAGSFGIATLVGRRGDDAHQLSDYRGLARSNPELAVAFTVLLLAQAGVPFTAGFFAKFYAVEAAVDASSIPLAVIAMLSAVVSAFLYLRIIVAMFMSGADDGDDGPAPARSERIPIPLGAGIALTLCVAVTMVVGLFPNLLVDAAEKGQPALVQYDSPTGSDAATGAADTGAGQ
jgi:NADH-quinone oxidoreductase subunit N